MLTESILFYFFASLALIGVVCLIMQSNPVASAICLILCFFGLSGLYVLLSATFIAILQLLVYAGAIMVLFVFVIMLLDLRKDDLVEDRVSLSLMVTALIIFGLCAGFVIRTLPFSPEAFGEIPADFGQATTVGSLMFQQYLVPFELTSILLLVAMIGAVFLGKRKPGGKTR